MKKLPIGAKLAELALLIVLSTLCMGAIEYGAFGMAASEIIPHRLANAALNVATLLCEAQVKRTAIWTIHKLRSFGVHLGIRRVTESQGPIGEATRTMTAIGELFAVQLALYYPIALAARVPDEVILLAVPELGIGCTLLWVYHRSFERLYQRVCRPLAVATRLLLRRARRMHQAIAQKGGPR